MLILWFFQKDIKNKFIIILQDKFFIILGLFLLLSLLSVLWSSDTKFALDYLRKYWHFLVIPIIYTSLLYDNINKVFNAFILGMLISVIVSFLVFFEIITLKNVLPHDPSAFMDHTNYSIYLVFTAILLLQNFFFSKEKRIKIFSLICFFPVVGNLFIINGNTGQISFFIVVFIVLFMTIKNKLKALLLSSICGVIIFFSAYNLSSTFNKRVHYTINDVTQIYKNNDFSGSFAQRVSFWIVGTNVFFDNILLGTGIGDEFDTAEIYIKKFNMERKYFADYNNYIDYHNVFVQYSVQLGFIGLFLILSLFYKLFSLSFKSKYLRNLSLSFSLLMFLLSCIGLSLHITHSMIFFSLFSGIFLSMSEKKI